MQKVVLRDSQIKLPTTAKLFGGLGLAATGFFGAELMARNLPISAAVNGFAGIAASIGLMVGWRVIGLRPGRGVVRALERGLHAVIYLVFWTMLFLGAVQVMHNMVRGRYDMPNEALVDVLSQGMTMAGAVLRFDTIAVLFLGGMVSAILAEWAWKRWH
ncbi:hypothetical protein C8J27_107212 [Rhodobacter aestuarii]|uniref:TrgA family protein n=1 Tax=Rhodobacter aestuarii TaxID=453582 RepID=A0A1N7NMW2_9RHOB|nr:MULTISPECIES: TrgA family protein [Rhodobacter]PTV94680.1 hypothetical protein C8J27_107212 [Rhodobacter aestuarii]SIS99519.1 hypothetical protein SAMN05421580_10815 [Rhodobacter aestuarii]SOC13177.1 hypothetical protein SAMN05877809_106212 [Rhodobacter sp. JA431]